MAANPLYGADDLNPWHKPHVGNEPDAEVSRYLSPTPRVYKRGDSSPRSDASIVDDDDAASDASSVVRPKPLNAAPGSTPSKGSMTLQPSPLRAPSEAGSDDGQPFTPYHSPGIVGGQEDGIMLVPPSPVRTSWHDASSASVGSRSHRRGASSDSADSTDSMASFPVDDEDAARFRHGSEDDADTYLYLVDRFAKGLGMLAPAGEGHHASVPSTAATVRRVPWATDVQATPATRREFLSQPVAGVWSAAAVSTPEARLTSAALITPVGPPSPLSSRAASVRSSHGSEGGSSYGDTDGGSDAGGDAAEEFCQDVGDGFREASSRRSSLGQRELWWNVLPPEGVVAQPPPGEDSGRSVSSSGEDGEGGPARHLRPPPGLEGIGFGPRTPATPGQAWAEGFASGAATPAPAAAPPSVTETPAPLSTPAAPALPSTVEKNQEMERLVDTLCHTTSPAPGAGEVDGALLQGVGPPVMLSLPPYAQQPQYGYVQAAGGRLMPPMRHSHPPARGSPGGASAYHHPHMHAYAPQGGVDPRAAPFHMSGYDPHPRRPHHPAPELAYLYGRPPARYTAQPHPAALLQQDPGHELPPPPPPPPAHVPHHQQPRHHQSPPSPLTYHRQAPPEGVGWAADPTAPAYQYPAGYGRPQVPPPGRGMPSPILSRRRHMPPPSSTAPPLPPAPAPPLPAASAASTPAVAPPELPPTTPHPSARGSDTDEGGTGSRPGATYKAFYKQFRVKERESFEAAKAFADESLPRLPADTHWRVQLELADLAKRENKCHRSRQLYREVTHTKPDAPQAWLEFAKMEEECGNMHRCQVILRQGLKCCPFNEPLLTKAIKHDERMGDLGGARELLGTLAKISLDKCWRTLLEGAQLEARSGRPDVARQVFKYLMKNVPWHGPIYHDAFRFEERLGNEDRALAIVDIGVKTVPRYGPLWFGAFRLHETMETKKILRSPAKNNVVLLPRFPRTRAALGSAVGQISKELVWKVYFEEARLEERASQLCTMLADSLTTASLPSLCEAPPTVDAALTEAELCLGRARAAFVQAALHAPPNLRWKVWLAGARMEMGAHREKTARALLDRASAEVPAKSRAQAMLEHARLEEYVGNIDAARGVLAAARKVAPHDWKVFLEGVLLERRCGDSERAMQLAEAALRTHTGTGRLWAILIQLRGAQGDEAQMSTFSRALQEVPKSGEVWCEGARIHMNPHSAFYDTVEAGRHLKFALQFTPQYGDSFIEWLRLGLLIAAGFGTQADDGSVMPDTDGLPLVRDPAGVVGVNVEKVLSAVDSSVVVRKCISADPNYGYMWFHCKKRPFDTARQVLERATGILVREIHLCRQQYAAAAVRGRTRCHDGLEELATEAEAASELGGGEEPTVDTAVLHTAYTSHIMGFVGLSQSLATGDDSRHKLVFGVDNIVA